MSGSAAALAPAAGPTVYVDVDGSTGYQKALACDALMVFSDLLEALAESRVFKSYFDGVNLSLCRVYFMGQEEPAPNTTTGGTLLSGKRTALASMPEVGFDVYIRIDTTAARLTTAAAGAGGRAASVSGVPVAVAAGGRASANEPLTFERLLINGGLPAAFMEAAAVGRARLKYGQLITLALMERNPAVAVEAYVMAKRLPSTATVKELQIKGYKLSGLLCDGSELVTCYKGQRVHLLKGLREDEAARARIFHDTFAGALVPHVTPYELVDSPGGKHFMIMPKFATALEPVPYLDPEGVAALWAHMEEALECLHAKGFTHADVKPANICLTEDGLSAFLIDLGSVAQVGQPTSSTLAYVPRNIARGRASTELDWWMLAMTLAEKACGPEHVLEVGGVHHASTAEVRTHLATHLSPAVWAALEPKLVG